jgi:hypothetical protein
MPTKLDTFVKCSRCGLLVWQGAMSETIGAMIPGNHEPVECEGVALPSKTAVCPGSEMLGQVEQLTSPPKKLTELEILNQLWVDHQIQLRPIFSDGTTVILRDCGVSTNELVWKGKEWGKWGAKSYPSLQSAFADLPTILEKSEIQTTIPI